MLETSHADFHCLILGIVWVLFHKTFQIKKEKFFFKWEESLNQRLNFWSSLEGKNYNFIYDEDAVNRSAAIDQEPVFKSS